MHPSLRIALSATVLVSLVACGGGGGGSGGASGPAISGTLSGNGYADNSILDKFLNFVFPQAFAVNANSPDYVAVFYDHGKSHQLFPIDANGGFSINTGGMSGSMIAFVVNSRNQTVFCHLNLTAGNETLDGIPKDKLTTNLVLGRIDTASNCVSSSSIASSGSFVASDVQPLTDLARNDDGLGLYINALINDNVQSYVGVRFEMGNMSTITGGSFNNVDATNFKSTYYAGSSPLFYLGAANRNVSAVSLYPPSTVTYANTLGAVNPSYGSTADTTHPVRKNGLSFNTSASVTTVETVAFNNYPAGPWSLYD